MQRLFPLLVLLIAQAGAAWALGDANMARPGATYSTIAADDAAACDRICADDTICMAWSFQGSSCELKATVPAQVARAGAVSGVSQRAPGWLRIGHEAPASAAPAPEQDIMVEPNASAQPSSLEEDELSLALLGGPEPEEDLRNRLGN